MDQEDQPPTIELQPADSIVSLKDEDKKVVIISDLPDDLKELESASKGDIEEMQDVVLENLDA